MKRLFVVLLSSLLLIGCARDSKFKADAIIDRAAVPVLNATTVTTLISDSGITRYRIQTSSWQVYDKAEPAYWEFSDGIYLERFDENMEIDTWLRSDYAYYNEEEEYWDLRGNVQSMNADSEFFATPQLIWNQKTERIHSDSAITITKTTSIIQGIGFESNQSLTKYTILNPTGVFPIED